MTTDMDTKCRAFRTDLEANVEATKTALLAAKATYDEAVEKLNAFVKAFGGAQVEAKAGPGPKAKAVKAPKAVKAVKAAPKAPKAVKAAPKTPAKAVKAAKTAKAPKVVAKAKAVKAAAPKAAKTAAKGKKGKKGKNENRRAAEGRAAVAQGLRPPIKDAMAQVMGDKVVNATEIFEALKAKNWLPNANDPRNYIAYVLSSSKTHFEKVPNRGRGFYRVKGTVTAASDNGKGKKAAEKAKSSDAILEEAGVGTGASVFGQ